MNLTNAFLRFYRRHLAKFLIFRYLYNFLLFIYKNIYQIAAYFYKSEVSANYSWLSLSLANNYRCKEYCKAIDGKKNVIAAPDFLGYEADAVNSRIKSFDVYSPDVTIHYFSLGVVIGGIDFIFLKPYVIHHDLYSPSEHNCPAENVGVISKSVNSDAIRLSIIKKTIFIDRAISLVGQCSSNYAHWLTEILPKLAVLNSINKYENWPILVDSGLHPNIYSSLYLINKDARQVIHVDKWQPG